MADINSFLLYEDNNILVFNKPIGLLVVKDPNKNEESLDFLVAAYLKTNISYPVHRLDKDTSGLVFFAKDKNTCAILSKAFSEHLNISKTYLTLVNGITDIEGRIEAPLRKSFERHKMVVAPISSGAKQAITEYKLKRIYKDSYSLLKVNLLTGRTHQIRAHFSYIRHHVIGDTKYGDYKVNNLFKKEYGLTAQFLHAYKVCFKELKGNLSYLSNKEFVAPLPEIFKKILNNLE